MLRPMRHQKGGTSAGLLGYRQQIGLHRDQHRVDRNKLAPAAVFCILLPFPWNQYTRMSRSLFQRDSRITFQVHAAFWIITLTIRLLIHYVYYENVSADIVLRTAINQLFQMGLVYVHLLLLIPRFLQQKKRLWYVLLLLLNLAGITAIKIGFKALVGLKYLGGYHEILQFLVLSIVYGAILMAYQFFQDEHKNQELKLKLKEAEQEKMVAELAALKAQIHPHFLFNTLNNIYALSMSQSAKTPAYILMLSELMSYMIYESNARFVTLEKEMKFIHHYIDLEKIRLDEKQEVRVDVSGALANYQIAPLLLIPLVENAFKHGAKGQNLRFLLQARVVPAADGDRFELICENDYEQQAGQEEVGGLGLANLQQRLDRLYPERHELTVQQQHGRYRVKLNVPLNQTTFNASP